MQLNIKAFANAAYQLADGGRQFEARATANIVTKAAERAADAAPSHISHLNMLDSARVNYSGLLAQANTKGSADSELARGFSQLADTMKAALDLKPVPSRLVAERGVSLNEGVIAARRVAEQLGTLPAETSLVRHGEDLSTNIQVVRSSLDSAKTNAVAQRLLA
jgi:hypothetical protein